MKIVFPGHFMPSLLQGPLIRDPANTCFRYTLTTVNHRAVMMLVKRLIHGLLPPRILDWIKKPYYARAVQSFWEADTEPLKYLVRSGDAVIDIGANVGDYTALLARLVGGDGRVYSIEPIPETFQLLSYVTRKLQYQNIQHINCAISETDGEASMEVPLYNYGAENFYQARIIPGGTDSTLRQHTVCLRSLDSLFLELARKITFIKCDVEGHELSVIRGARDLLAKSKPAWLIEISGSPDDANSPSHELFRLLQDQNYTAYWFNGRILKRRVRGDSSVNYFFLQPRHVDQLAVLRDNIVRRGGVSGEQSVV